MGRVLSLIGRTAFFLALPCLIASALPASASDLIPGKWKGTSEAVKQPHVVAELISESMLIEPGKPFNIIVHLHMDKGWHTYWINPGGAGLATRIEWTLPPGFTAGAIQWPTPEVHAMGPITTYGYAGDVYLLTTITPPASIPRASFPPLKARVSWLVCQEECIPGKADFIVPVVFNHSNSGKTVSANGALFAAAQARLPVANARWDVSGSYGERAEFKSTGHPGFNLHLVEKGPSTIAIEPPKTLRFFAEQPNVLANNPSDQGAVSVSDKGIAVSSNLEQNGEKPDHLSGILVSEDAIVGHSKSVYLTNFPVTAERSVASAPPTQTPAASPSQAPEVPMTIPTEQPLLLVVLGAAFLGGLILNLMPCVLPVLSLKVFSLVRHAGEHPGSAWKQGVAFTVGVVISFWALAGLLLILRGASHELGWGFQMQSPGFVLALIFLFFLLSLNLFGVFEFGTSLVGLDAKASSGLGGYASSFANGALATVAATPCTAPFMGSSIGFAAQQPGYIALLIFTVLALGMATPYLLLTTFPAALRFVPKPGPWMEAFKQFMGFLLMATVIFLVYVFGSLVSDPMSPSLLFALLIAGVAAWIYGRWTSPLHSRGVRFAGYILAALAFAYSLNWGIALSREEPPAVIANQMPQDGWQPYSAEAVSNALADKRPVFVDFTAAWCLSCKVNERVALDIDSTRKAFQDKNVLLLRGDWTHSDPAITEALRQYNRDGVPLYLLYSPKNPGNPQVLPEVLTPGIVQDALQKL